MAAAWPEASHSCILPLYHPFAKGHGAIPDGGPGTPTGRAVDLFSGSAENEEVYSWANFKDKNSFNVVKEWMITVENGKVNSDTYKEKKIKNAHIPIPPGQTTHQHSDKICLFLLFSLSYLLPSYLLPSLPSFLLPSFHLSDKFYHRHPWRFWAGSTTTIKQIITIKQVQVFLVSQCM